MMNLEGRIKEIEKELAEMKLQLANENSLQLQGGNGFLVHLLSTPSIILKSTDLSVIKGIFRQTRELAEISQVRAQAGNILEAYAMQIEPEWREDWSGKGYNYFIGYQHRSNSYRVADAANTKDIGLVYMSNKTAKILCDALNNKEIVL